MKHYILSERANLFDPNIIINFVFEITGNPSVLKLERSIMQAYSVNETIMSKVIMDSNGKAAYEPISECKSTVTVTNKDWSSLIKENEKVPFAIWDGEMIRTFIIQNNGKMSILIMAHHIVGDGKSIVYFIEDFMNALAENEIIKKQVVLFSHDTLRKLSKKSLFMKWYTFYFNKKWRKYDTKFSFEDYYLLHKTYWESKTSVILYKRYTKKELLNLYEEAKKNHVSLNNLIIAAFQKASTTFQKVGIAVDGRIDDNRNMSNQATGISIKSKYIHKKSLIYNAKQVQKKVHKKLVNCNKKYFILQFMSLLEPTLVDSIVFETYGLIQNPVSRKMADLMAYSSKKENLISITNLTRIKIQQKYGLFQIKNIIFIPPVISYAKRVIGIVSDEDGMTITYHFMNELSELKEKEFFDLAHKNLHTIHSS